VIKEVTSFNKVFAEFKARRSFRDFCLFKNKNLTPNRILSEFRDYLMPSGFEEITRLITLTLLNTVKLSIVKVAVLDATDMPASCSGFAKKMQMYCKCKCPKKYTARLWLKIKGKNLMIPLISFIEPANVHEGKFLNPMIQNTQNELSLHIDRYSCWRHRLYQQ